MFNEKTLPSITKFIIIGSSSSTLIVGSDYILMALINISILKLSSNVFC